MAGQGQDLPYCDLVMKGGITSGVVYPLAITELSRKYRFKSIGGASAGAIAAAAAAAAEKGRGQNGFAELEAVSSEIATKLLSLFQPAPPVEPVFEAALAAIGKGGVGDKVVGALGKLLLGYAPSVFLGAVPGLALAFVAFRSEAPLGWTVAAAIALLVGVVVALGVRLWLVLARDLPRNGFGLCSGTTMDGKPQGLTAWLTELFDRLADKENGPLTFGDLVGPDPKKPEIDLQIMTTCLGQGRPYRLPFTTDIFMWKESEFRELFGEELVEFMAAHCPEVDGHAGYRFFPRAEHLPVVVAVRMSLSFPVLLSAVPLYTRDFTLNDADARRVPLPCWFSDGGICSNFPIHFFDSPWPSHPTFGISLEAHRPESHGDDQVVLPQQAVEGITRPLRPVTTLFGFLGAIVDTMQEWRDVLQGCLPGYRERVATVLLRPDEGGLNLAMPPELVTKLGDYGKLAGSLLRDQFSFDRHRWRRHLVFTSKLEGILESGLSSYTVPPPHGETLEAFLDRYAKNPDEYRQSAEWVRDADQDMKELVELSRAWLARGKLARGRIPKPGAVMRITPKV
jgi:hypothetical protein